MATIKETQRLVDKYSKKMVMLLGLAKYKITFVVANSTNKDLRAVLTPPIDYAAALFYYLDTSLVFDILIFADEQHGYKDILGSLFHELLHIKFRILCARGVYKKSKLSKKLEEKLVQDVEKLFIAFL